MTEKWYVGLKPNEVTLEMSRLYQNCYAHAIQGDMVGAEKYHDEFFDKYFTVVHAIVDMKSAFYASRRDNDLYTLWNNCLDNIKLIRRELERDLLQITRKVVH